MTERALRPLTWVLKNRYEDRLPEIVEDAIGKAGSVDALTSTHTREAVGGWKRRAFGTRRDGTQRKTEGAISQAATAAAKAHKLRLKMLAEVAEMYQLAGKDEKALAEFNGFLDDLDQFLDEHANGEAA